MSNTLKWTNPNASFDEIQIYRSEVKPVAGEVPTNKVATITDGSTTWTDNTAALNKYYWYWIAVKKGADVVYGYPHMAINMPYTGPGPQELLAGDWMRGYFGTVSSADFFTNQELVAWLGVGTPYNIAHTWYKFVLNGKILFFPERHVSGNLSWNALYLAGVMYGVAGNGPATGHGQTPTEQRRVITKGEHSFVVRMPRCQVTPDYSFVTRQVYESEWYLSMGSIFGMYNPAPALDLADNPVTSFSAGAHLFVEFTGANAAYYGTTPMPNSPSSTGVRTGNSNWRPVLELVLL